ncbi:MAG: DUF177 domain-containing protein [Oscillospiraceae bacterium]|nr:DUF177 domain-containing protein [Oscillospiraceae bacterium]MDD4369199.1 DUF177 domain-containing protein [Oscillospiraceae bacterium]
MRIDIREVGRQNGSNLPVHLQVPASEILQSYRDFSFPGLLFVSGNLRYEGQGKLRFDGSGQFSWQAPCARCLETVSQEETVRLRLSFRNESQCTSETGSEPAATGEEPETTADIPCYPYTGHIIDLTTALTEAIILALPTKVLCRADCRGLCPHCGQDLNEGPCTCRTEQTGGSQSPFGALNNLL